MMTTATKTTKRTAAQLSLALNHATVRRAKEWGTWTWTRTYFYRHGRSVEQMAAQVREVFPEARVVRTEDDFGYWRQQGKMTVEFLFPDELTVEQATAKVKELDEHEYDLGQKRYTHYWTLNESLPQEAANRIASTYSRQWAAAYDKAQRARQVLAALTATAPLDDAV